MIQDDEKGKTLLLSKSSHHKTDAGVDDICMSMAIKLIVANFLPVMRDQTISVLKVHIYVRSVLDTYLIAGLITSY